MIDPRDFFLRYSGLQPIGFKPIGEGLCNCQAAKRTLVYKKAGVPQCAACCCLRQNYAVKNKPSVRLGLGSYLFISPDRLRFWGNHDMQAYNPKFECEPAAGRMSDAMRALVLDPPKPPWMFVSFAASINASTLAITTDPTILRFGGQTIINRTEIREINRAQVIQMHSTGLTKTRWDQYLGAYYRNDIAIIQEVETAHPDLQTIRFLPPKEATEHVVLRWLLTK